MCVCVGVFICVRVFVCACVLTHDSEFVCACVLTYDKSIHIRAVLLYSMHTESEMKVWYGADLLSCMRTEHIYIYSH